MDIPEDRFYPKVQEAAFVMVRLERSEGPPEYADYIAKAFEEFLRGPYFEVGESKYYAVKVWPLGESA